LSGLTRNAGVEALADVYAEQVSIAKGLAEEMRGGDPPAAWDDDFGPLEGPRLALLR